MRNKFHNNLDLFSGISFLIIVPLLVTGPFLPDAILSLNGFIFLIMTFFKRDLLKYYEKKFTIFFIIFYIIILISSILSSDTMFSLESSLFYFRFYFFSIFVFYIISKYQFLIKYFFYISIFTFVILSFDATYQYFNKTSFLFSYPIQNTYRASSLFGEELKLGNFISRLSPLIIGLCLYLYKNEKLNYFFLFIFLICILVSGERTAFALFLIFFSLYLFKEFKLINFFKYFISLLFIFLILISSSDVKNRMLEKTYSQFFSTSNNLLIFSTQHNAHYRSAYKMFEINKLFGVGPKMFRHECSKEKYGNYEQACSTHPHNVYLQLMSETGILGFLVIFIVFLITTFNLFTNSINKNKSIYDYVSYILLISIFINLWPFAPSFNFFNNWINVVYYLPIGFILYFNKIKND